MKETGEPPVGSVEEDIINPSLFFTTSPAKFVSNTMLPREPMSPQAAMNIPKRRVIGSAA